MAEKDANQNVEKPLDQQAREQTGQQQIKLHVDERNMKSSYTNAFRTNGTAEEVMLDFGLNTMAASSNGNPGGKWGQPPISHSYPHFCLSSRERQDRKRG